MDQQRVVIRSLSGRGFGCSGCPRNFQNRRDARQHVLICTSAQGGGDDQNSGALPFDPADEAESVAGSFGGNDGESRLYSILG